SARARWPGRARSCRNGRGGPPGGRAPACRRRRARPRGEAGRPPEMSPASSLTPHVASPLPSRRRSIIGGMTWRFRPRVTAHDAQGRSMVLMASLAPNVKEIPSMPGLAITDLWETTEAPARNEGSADSADRLVRLEPPRNGTILRIVEFPPDAHWRNRTDAREAFDAIQATHAPERSSSDPMMHKTLTGDSIAVLNGRIHPRLR